MNETLEAQEIITDTQAQPTPQKIEPHKLDETIKLNRAMRRFKATRRKTKPLKDKRLRPAPSQKTRLFDLVCARCKLSFLGGSASRCGCKVQK